MTLELFAEPEILPLDRQLAIAVLAGDKVAAMALADRYLAELHGGAD